MCIRDSDCIIGDYCILSNNSTLAGHIKIGNYVVLSGLTAIHQFCSIGDYAFISGGSKVRKDVPPFVKAAKEPLSFIGVNSIGLNRNGFSSEKVQEIQIYIEFFFNKIIIFLKQYLSLKQKLKQPKNVTIFYNLY